MVRRRQLGASLEPLQKACWRKPLGVRIPLPAFKMEMKNLRERIQRMEEIGAVASTNQVLDDFKKKLEKLAQSDQRLFLECLENSQFQAGIFIRRNGMHVPLYEILIDELPNIEDSCKKNYLEIVHAVRLRGCLEDGFEVAKEFPEAIKRVRKERREDFIKRYKKYVKAPEKKYYAGSFVNHLKKIANELD